MWSAPLRRGNRRSLRFESIKNNRKQALPSGNLQPALVGARADGFSVQCGTGHERLPLAWFGPYCGVWVQRSHVMLLEVAVPFFHTSNFVLISVRRRANYSSHIVRSNLPASAGGSQAKAH